MTDQAEANQQDAYELISNQCYRPSAKRSDIQEACQLDLYYPTEKKDFATVVWFHGGGLTGGKRSIPEALKNQGIAIAAVDYRLSPKVEVRDCIDDAAASIAWVFQNIKSLGGSEDRIFVSGHSAGGHLSLTTGMLEAEGGLDRLCPVRRPVTGVADGALPEMPVAAIVNWFGITDVADLVTGPNAKQYAMAWMGNQTDWRTIADRVSPMFMIRDRLPPILTIHGDADTIVPYAHATRLHEALRKQGAKEKLHTISGGGHGRFTLEENVEAMRVIRDFLVEHEIL